MVRSDEQILYYLCFRSSSSIRPRQNLDPRMPRAANDGSVTKTFHALHTHYGRMIEIWAFHQNWILSSDAIFNRTLIQDVTMWERPQGFKDAFRYVMGRRAVFYGQPGVEA